MGHDKIPNQCVHRHTLGLSGVAIGLLDILRDVEGDGHDFAPVLQADIARPEASCHPRNRINAPTASRSAARAQSLRAKAVRRRIQVGICFDSSNRSVWPNRLPQHAPIACIESASSFLPIAQPWIQSEHGCRKFLDSLELSFGSTTTTTSRLIFTSYTASTKP